MICWTSLNSSTALLHIGYWLAVKDATLRRALRLPMLQLASAIRTWQDKKWKVSHPWAFHGDLMFSPRLPESLRLCVVSLSCAHASPVGTRWVNPDERRLATTDVARLLQAMFADLLTVDSS